MGISIGVYYAMILIALLVVLLIAVLFLANIKEKFLGLFENLAELISNIIKSFLSKISFGLIR